MTVTRITELSSFAQSALHQLFVRGPTWDGFMVSKTGRDELVDLGMAERGDGWQWLTRAGVAFCTVNEGANIPREWGDGSWRQKACTNNGS